MIRPELCPECRFLVRGLDAVREKDGSLAGEDGLARNGCKRRNPGEDRLLPESQAGLPRGERATTSCSQSRGAPRAVTGTAAVASAAEAATAFVAQLTTYTETTGKANGDSTALTAPIYGPYLKTTTLPTNPFNEKAGVTCDITTSDVTSRTAVPGDGTGWKFYVKTGVLIANDNTAHQGF